MSALSLAIRDSSTMLRRNQLTPPRSVVEALRPDDRPGNLRAGCYVSPVQENRRKSGSV
ncbi:hypothetical protein ACFWBI_39385 [Streptomyces sp. NPDC059982]|uniref:hypothetical protein n=1 Tax=Streptomyces sp. NPDC059982 TaxID=3347024 RepID=UPI0036C65F0D